MINCGAYTAVDKAETPEGRRTCWAPNAAAPSLMVRTWADIDALVFDLTNGNGDRIVPVSTDERCASAAGPIVPRPEHSDLDLSKIYASGFAPRDWEEELVGYFARL